MPGATGATHSPVGVQAVGTGGVMPTGGVVPTSVIPPPPPPTMPTMSIDGISLVNVNASGVVSGNTPNGTPNGTVIPPSVNQTTVPTTTTTTRNIPEEIARLRAELNTSKINQQKLIDAAERKAARDAAKAFRDVRLNAEKQFGWLFARVK